MVEADEPYVISSGDAIVYRILGNLNRAEAGLSLEEIVQRIGLARRNPSRPHLGPGFLAARSPLLLEFGCG